MKGFCRVCPHCNGIACAGEVPGMGSAGTGSSFIRNVQALETISLVMRSLHRIEKPDTTIELFGRRLSMPILAAPVGGVAFNMTRSLSEQAYLEALVQGVGSAGSLAGTGDGELEEIFEAAEALPAQDGLPVIPFIKPWEGEMLADRVRRIEALGPPAFGMDVDSIGLVTLGQTGRSVRPKTDEDLARIVKMSSLPFIVKGIMSPEEALAVRDAGAAAIVVSNHGGRVLDSSEATAEALPKIVEAVDGGCSILVDGGIRSGTDVFKMLALGADAVLVGRPFAVAAIGGGSDAVESEILRLQKELSHAMLMTGCPRIENISSYSLARY